jgi:hypothetical protein
MEMKPVERFTLGERVREALAETELALCDGFAASATFRSPARSGLDDVRHTRIEARAGGPGKKRDGARGKAQWEWEWEWGRPSPL